MWRQNIKGTVQQPGSGRATPVDALLLLLYLFFCLSSPVALSESGMNLARAVYERSNGADSTLAGTMLLESAQRAPRIRDFQIFQRNPIEGLAITLIRFQAPANIAGTALLDDPGQDGVWLYLPALDRVRRISSSNRGGRFVNSQLFFEDLRERHPDEDEHQLLGSDDFEGVTTTLMQSIPKPDNESAYSKRVSWIHPELYLPLQVDFYSGGEEPSKRLTVRRIDQIQGYWTVTESVMQDLESGDSTTLTVHRISYDQDLPDVLFSTSALKNRSLGEEYLP